MLVDSESTRVELLRIKKNTFALIFNNKADDIESVVDLLNDLPACQSNPQRLAKIHKAYDDILNSRAFSLDDVYEALGIDSESNIPLFFHHKRLVVKQYRDIISKIIEKTQDQIKRNTHTVNICSLAYSIFFKVQEFTPEKPKYISNMWFLGNCTTSNAVMKKAFEQYTRASNEKKNDPVFCSDCLVELFEAIKYSVKDSFRIHYLDSVVDQMFHWYFTESEISYDFLIFIPDTFDEVRNFLLEIIDKNPFFYFVKKNGYYYDRCLEDDTCLDSDSVICISDDLFSEIKCFRDLNRLLDTYYLTHRALYKYGMFNCLCYDITDSIPNSISKNLERQKNSFQYIKAYLKDEKFLFKFQNVIHDKETFIKTIVKPQINELLKSNSADITSEEMDLSFNHQSEMLFDEDRKQYRANC